ncbi:hypothetical protein H6F40_11035 [Microcystis wesenbergii FACHB-1339]|nr:hypothetical protein [Microcystis wesenbergii FACHB-1339]
MIFYGCMFCKHINRGNFNDCSAFPSGIPLSIIGGEQIHDSEWDNQSSTDIFELADSAKEIPILLQSVPSEAYVWDQEDFQSLGVLGEQAVIQVGILPTDKLVCVTEPIAVDNTLFEDIPKGDFEFEEEPVPDSISVNAVPLNSLSGVSFYE